MYVRPSLAVKKRSPRTNNFLHVKRHVLRIVQRKINVLKLQNSHDKQGQVPQVELIVLNAC